MSKKLVIEGLFPENLICLDGLFGHQDRFNYKAVHSGFSIWP